MKKETGDIGIQSPVLDWEICIGGSQPARSMKARRQIKAGKNVVEGVKRLVLGREKQNGTGGGKKK